MSPEARDLLQGEQGELEVEFPAGTINVEGAEGVTRGKISRSGKAVVLSYLHPCCGAGGTIQEILTHKVGSGWVKDGDFTTITGPNGGSKGKE